MTVLKDELLPLRKIKSNTTRTIDASNLDHLLVFRHYFGHMCEAQARSFPKAAGSCVGFNPHVDFEILYKLLKSKSDFGIDVDAKRWDGTIPPIFWEGVARVSRIYYFRGYLKDLDTRLRKEFKGEHIEFDSLRHRFKIPHDLKDEAAKIQSELYAKFEREQNVRDTLVDELCSTVTLTLGELIQQLKGVCSGNPSTAGFNSILHAIIAMTAWLMCTDGTYLDSLDAFDEHVEFFTYGDDGIYGITEEALPYYNRLTLKDCFETFGMQLTAANKTGEIKDYDRIEDLTFCKRSFNRLPNGSVLCPIEERTLNSLLNWERKRGDLADNLDVYFFELFYFGKERYESESQKVLESLLYHGVRCTIPTWKEQYARWINMHSNVSCEYNKRTVVHRADLMIERLSNKHPERILSRNPLTFEGGESCQLCKRVCLGLITSAREDPMIPGPWPRCLECAHYTDVPPRYYKCVE